MMTNMTDPVIPTPTVPSVSATPTVAPAAPVVPVATPDVVATSGVLRGVIRTTVPYVIAFLVTLLGSRGIHLPSDIQAQLATVITVVIGSVWYTVVRQLEKINPAFGWLLGSPGAPLYLPTGVTVPQTTAVTPGAQV